MREQLTATGRVLIFDMVMPEDSTPSPAKVLDIQMLVMTPDTIAEIVVAASL